SFTDGDSAPSAADLLAQAHQALLGPAGDQGGSNFLQFVRTEESALHTVLRGAEFGQLKALAEKAADGHHGTDRAALEALDQLMAEVVNVRGGARGHAGQAGTPHEAAGD